MTRQLLLLLFLLSFLLSTPTVLAQSAAGAEPPAAWRAIAADGPWVVILEHGGPAAVPALQERFDIWSLRPRELTTLVTRDQYAELRRDGYAPRLDAEQTRAFARRGVPLVNQRGGIPGFPCYRTVGETYASAAALASANPQIASWIDIGDSWEKTQNAAAGFDLRVLKLTNSATLGPKPVFFASFAIHAREYATAELGTRFAEHLVNGYGTDPDITWLLDHQEVHLLLQANPDGRTQAETGDLWRKNTNNDYCSNTTSRGVDLNRNFDFQWNCCAGSSGDQCSDVYRGPLAASEPEIQAHQDYVRSIFPDQRGPGIDEPAPADATGVAIDVHSFGRLVLWPWGFIVQDTPNATAFATLGRKLAFFNAYEPTPITGLTVADGSSADFYYGELGIAGFGYEIGTSFFQSCASFESTVLDVNIDSLLFAAKVARAPYQLPSGPEALGAAITSGGSFAAGSLERLTATLDDTRFNHTGGTEPTQTIASAEAFVGTPPWQAGAVPLAMVAADGTFDEGVEDVELMIDTAGLGGGRHLVFVRGTDSAGNTGPVTAVFLELGDVLFADDFETGDTTGWSSTSP